MDPEPVLPVLAELLRDPAPWLAILLLGDTVNTASRMQTSGVPGCIQVTEWTRDLLGDRYLYQERGMIQVKGKGKMLTYVLSGRARKHNHLLDLTEPH